MRTVANLIARGQLKVRALGHCRGIGMGEVGPRVAPRLSGKATEAMPWPPGVTIKKEEIPDRTSGNGPRREGGDGQGSQ